MCGQQIKNNFLRKLIEEFLVIFLNLIITDDL